MVQYICCIMVFLFVCGAVLPACSAQTNILQTDEEKMFLESPVNKAKQINYESESYFDYALIWGPFEELWVSSLFTLVHVLNREPWNNLTINVIGYQSWTGNWTVKKASYVKCNFLHLGIIGRNWLCVIGIRNVDAW
jgi:hypothetical protein